MEYSITTPLTSDVVSKLRAGDMVKITGTIYTARDAAHARMVEALNQGKELPFDAKGAIIYYAGPAPAPEGAPIGSVGPTTSYRMDPFAPRMMEEGAIGMIGKGLRDASVHEAIQTFGGIYFAAIGGAGALLAKSVKAAKIVDYEDLGAEALRELKVEDFPCTVVIDCLGNDLYEIGRREYLESLK